MLPRDVADIKLHGRIVVGRDIKGSLPMPSFVQMREAAVYFVYWFAEYWTDEVESPTTRAIVNSIFMIAGTLYLIKTGEMPYTKCELAQRYAALPGLPYPVLVARASEVRREWATKGYAISSGEQRRMLGQYEDFRRTAARVIERMRLNEFSVLRASTPGILWIGPDPNQEIQANSS